MANPVVVIPGYYGSKLAAAASGEIVWLTLLGLGTADLTLRSLRLDPHEREASCWLHGEGYCFSIEP